MNELSIGEVARQAGLRASAVRYYERRGLLPVPRRVNGRRCYSPDIVQRLTVIRFAQRAGFSLEEIRSLFHTGMPWDASATQWQRAARQKLVQLDSWIEQLQRMKAMLARGIKCACQRIEECAIIDRAWWDIREPPSQRLQLT